MIADNSIGSVVPLLGLMVTVFLPVCSIDDVILEELCRQSGELLNLLFGRLLLPLRDRRVDNRAQVVPIDIRKECCVVSCSLLQAILQERVEVIVEALAYYKDLSTLARVHQRGLATARADINVDSFYLNQACHQFMLARPAREVKRCPSGSILSVRIRLKLENYLEEGHLVVDHSQH